MISTDACTSSLRKSASKGAPIVKCAPSLSPFGRGPTESVRLPLPNSAPAAFY
jgi:hypothetical protein